MAETFAQRLERLRTDAGMSQRQLAALASGDGVHISGAYLSRLEHGARSASVHVIRALARPLNVSAHYLEFGEPDPVGALRLKVEALESRRRADKARIRELTVRVGELEAMIEDATRIDEALLVAARRVSAEQAATR